MCTGLSPHTADTAYKPQVDDICVAVRDSLTQDIWAGCEFHVIDVSNFMHGALVKFLGTDVWYPASWFRLQAPRQIEGGGVRKSDPEPADVALSRRFAALELAIRSEAIGSPMSFIIDRARVYEKFLRSGGG